MSTPQTFIYHSPYQEDFRSWLSTQVTDPDELAALISMCDDDLSTLADLEQNGIYSQQETVSDAGRSRITNWRSLEDASAYFTRYLNRSYGTAYRALRHRYWNIND